MASRAHEFHPAVQQWFDSAFERKAAAVETAVMMLDTDGVWRVSGAFIR